MGNAYNNSSSDDNKWCNTFDSIRNNNKHDTCDNNSNGNGDNTNDGTNDNVHESVNPVNGYTDTEYRYKQTRKSQSLSH